MSLFGGIELPGKPDPENVRRLGVMPVPMIRRMQRMGIAIDREWLWALSSKLEQRKAELSKDIGSYIPRSDLDSFVGESGEELGEFNVESAPQMAELLFSKLKIGAGERLKTTKSGKRLSTGKKQLEGLKWRHPVIPLVLEYRECSKLKSTYADALPALARAHNAGECGVCGLRHKEAHYRVHTELPTTRTDTDRLASRRPNLQNCFSGDTEVLTMNGWVRLDQYDRASQVATWSLDGIAFDDPIGFVEQESDWMIHLQSCHIDLLVTPDHRCLLRNRRTSEYVVHRAAHYPEDWLQLSGGKYTGGAGAGLSTAEIAFMLAIQADGHWRPSGSLQFAFRKRRKIERFRHILEVLGLSFREHAYRKNVIFGISRRKNSDVLQKMWDLIGGQKLFRWDIFLAFDASQADFAMDEIMFWDGLWTRKTSYSSKHKHNVDVISTLFTLHERRAIVRPWVNPETGNEYWLAGITRENDYTLTTNREMDWLEWEEKVYCVSVPSTFLLVRRNGKTMITGNCPARTPMGREVRKAFIATPGKRLVSVDYSQIELRILADRAIERNMIRIFKDGLDIHADTAMRAFNLALEEVTSNEGKLLYRAPCKNVNFGICFGLTPSGLLDLMAVTYATANMKLPDWLTFDWCESFVEKWFNLYPDAQEYFELQAWRARRYQCSWCMFGGVRRIPEVRSTHNKVIAAGLRQAGNNPIQRGAAGVFKIGMARVERRFEELRGSGIECEALLPIHDELVSEVDEEWAEEVSEVVGAEMAKSLVDEATGELRCRVPVLTEAKIMERWAK